MHMPPLAAKLKNAVLAWTENAYIVAIRDSVMLTIPLFMIGSLFLIFTSLPIAGYEAWMSNLFGSGWKQALLYPIQATYGISALVISFGIAYRLAEREGLDALMCGVLSLVSLFIMIPDYRVIETSEAASIRVDGVIPASYLGSKGIFVGMIVAALSYKLYQVLMKRKALITLPPQVPALVARSFSALIPALAMITFFLFVRISLEAAGYQDLFEVVATLAAEPMKQAAGSLGGVLVIIVVMQLFWLAGIHGGALIGAIVVPIWITLMDENRLAYTANPQLPLPNIVTQQFFDVWISIGGAGSLLALVVLMNRFARSRQARVMGRVSLIPALFNISEPVIYSIPIVLNPRLGIPFILTPVVTAAATYAAMSWGWVARPVGIAVPWTTPIGISGFLATGGKWSGAVMQLVNFMIAMLIYYPFFKAWDQSKQQEEPSEQALSAAQ
ncbi:PTS sugar transporter subunit IIC [Paenibacillus aquistagni]|uniref:PTS sugar transporter subunit IIC n=1 Tax=Paenibacillus aquistagni TaxID=1852522 RepID=UPI00216564A3|nr:PTS transporter subunit EIIC [Paenibacillus aquistagni]